MTRTYVRELQTLACDVRSGLLGSPKKRGYALDLAGVIHARAPAAIGRAV